MLLYRSHWHIAREQDPTREARLLAFASNTPDPSNPSPATGESAPPEPEKDVDSMSMEQAVREMLKLQRAQAKAAIQRPPEKQPPTEPPQDKAAAEKKIQEERQPQEDEFTKKEAVRNKFMSLIEKSRGIASKMKDLKARMENKDVLERLKEHAPPEVQKQWQERMLLLEQESFNTTQETMFAEGLMQFWEGGKSPEMFLAEQGQYLKNLPYGFAQTGEILHDLIAGKSRAEAEALTGCSEEAWQTANESSRIETINSLLKNVQMDEWIASTTDQYMKMGKVLDAEEKVIDQDIKTIENLKSLEEMGQMTSFIDTLRGIRWYSINNYIDGLKKFWAALKSTWEQRNERYSADIARKIGQLVKKIDIFPVYGQEVSRILDQQLDAKSKEETEAMKNHFEHDNANWAMLFGPGGEFLQFARSNPNKARGVLEYAADHGFLYDIDDNVGITNYPIYGVYLTDICSDWDKHRIDNYYTLLRTKNSAGRDKEIKSGKEKEHDIENVPLFIQLLEQELDDHNLWTAAGICERAMERGLNGEISAWLLTTVMSKLRQYPELRKVTPKLFFDIIGKLGMYNTAFTLGLAKGYRKQLAVWAKTGDEGILEKTEMRHMTVIEKDILAKKPDIDRTTKEGRAELNHLTAKVLAGHIVELPGGYIHIFETRFKSYRENVKYMFADMAKPLQEDSDYANEDTEKAMLTWETFGKILSYTSTREFTNNPWASAFMGSLISIAERLRHIPELKEAYDNYCMEVHEKLDRYFGSYKADATAVKQLASIDPKTRKPAIASLVAARLLSWSVMKDAAYAKQLQEQLKEFFPEFYVDVILKESNQNKPSVKKPDKPSVSGASQTSVPSTAA